MSSKTIYTCDHCGEESKDIKDFKVIKMDHMAKVKNIYYTKDLSKVGGSFSTGLIIELENGDWLRHQSTDPILTFEPILPLNPSLLQV